MNKKRKISESRFLEQFDGKYWLTVYDAYNNIGVSPTTFVSMSFDYEVLRCIALRTSIPKEFPINLEPLGLSQSKNLYSYMEALPITTTVKIINSFCQRQIYVSIGVERFANFYTASFNVSLTNYEMAKVVELLNE